MEPFLGLSWYLPWGSGWPIYCGALVGLVGTAVAGGRRLAARPAFWTATAISLASAGAFLGLVWVRDTYRPVGHVGVFEHLAATWSPATQFLSNEQFSMFATLWRLAWVLPAVAIVAAVVALWAFRYSRASGRGN